MFLVATELERITQELDDYGKDQNDMMRHLGISMRVTCKKDEILSALKKNRETHAKLCAEARVGYLSAAQTALEKKLGALREGKLAALSFSLVVPKDFTAVYDTTIAMLESHTGETIELDADEYRHLVQDEWEWTRDFLVSNSHYSEGTRGWAAEKAFNIE